MAEVRAEMVANVWRVLVKEGDVVEEGDTLAILESMKMEIPVVSEDEGTVVKVAVKGGDESDVKSMGDVVQEGDLLFVIE
ncbi:biotin/lipoyl-binding carrier protein [Longispora albida]|uniref:biotin/lipoyl-binding carrier protein n=1 Tax=Longispora albida TaxID=203523 RepID=UPI00037B7394|nr:biotin/lipoyl-binding carrier protein [Longispora albida]